MKLLPPTDSGFEDDAADRCGICHQWLDEDGDCDLCGNKEERAASSLDRAFDAMENEKLAYEPTFNNGKTYEQ